MTENVVLTSCTSASQELSLSTGATLAKFLPQISPKIPNFYSLIALTSQLHLFRSYSWEHEIIKQESEATVAEKILWFKTRNMMAHLLYLGLFALMCVSLCTDCNIRCYFSHIYLDTQ